MIGHPPMQAAASDGTQTNNEKRTTKNEQQRATFDIYKKMKEKN
jgi:hypothetical protein